MSSGLLPNAVREQFHVPGAGPYYLAHSVGASPVVAAAALEAQFLKPWREQGGDAWPEWLVAIEGFRESIAAVIGGSAAEICPQPNVSAAFERYLGALPRVEGRHSILMAEESFPSLGYVAQAAVNQGYEVHFLPTGARVDDPATWEAAITEETAIVLAMHVYSNSGTIAPVADIARLAHAKGARVAVDLAQSTGIVPVAVRDWSVDAAVGSCVKWLSGGPGAGYLWVRQEDIATLKPKSVGWFSHENPFEMDIRDFRYAPDALRFWGGTPDVAPFVIAKAGIDTILGIGITAIRAHNEALQGHFREALERVRPNWIWPGDTVGGTLCIDVGADKERILAAFAETGTRVDFRGSVLRLSFAAWNGLDGVEATVGLLST